MEEVEAEGIKAEAEAEARGIIDGLKGAVDKTFRKDIYPQGCCSYIVNRRALHIYRSLARRD